MEIPTIEEFFKKYSCNTSLSEGNYDYLIDKDDFRKAMVEFTKLHAVEILKKLSKTEMEYQRNIQYVYPLSNIK